MKLDLKKKHKVILIITACFIPILIVGGIFLFGIYSNLGASGTSTIDTSFDQWEITGTETPLTHIKEIQGKGYIEALNLAYRASIEAQLSFDMTRSGTLVFKARTPSSEKGAFNLELMSGDTRIILVRKNQKYASWSIFLPEKSAVKILNYDTEWHEFEIKFKINGENSTVEISIDGLGTFIPKQHFSTIVEGINNIKFAPAMFYTPSRTHLIFESFEIST